MMDKRLLVLGLALATGVTVFVVACGGGGEDTPSGAGGTGSGGALAEALETGRLHIERMVASAEANDLEGAKTHNEAADPSLHEVIEVVEASDAALATELEEAVEDAEADLEKGEQPDHIAEVGGEILALLKRAG